MACRICRNDVETVIDLGNMPPANWLMDSATSSVETYPLLLERCATCSSLQLRFCLAANVLYGHYFYMTPESPSLSRHYEWLIDYLQARNYVDGQSDVLEIGSNRGAFLEALAPHVRSIVGVDPAENVVQIARSRGIDTICDYFDAASAQRISASGRAPALIVARHCMAHNEYPQEMLAGASRLLSPDGVLVIENNYAGKMIGDSEFDQIYHEHMFYYSLTSLDELLRRSGFRVIDVALTSVHGGSIVCFAAREASSHVATAAVTRLLETERTTLSKENVARFAVQAYVIRDDLRATMRRLQETGVRIAAYGATAKGATLLNFCGLTSGDIEACADSTEIKQGRFIPGTAIPIVAEKELFEDPPDYFLLTAWNYATELIAKTRAAGAEAVRFIVPIPHVSIVD